MSIEKSGNGREYIKSGKVEVNFWRMSDSIGVVVITVTDFVRLGVRNL